MILSGEEATIFATRLHAIIFTTVEIVNFYSTSDNDSAASSLIIQPAILPYKNIITIINFNCYHCAITISLLYIPYNLQ